MLIVFAAPCGRSESRKLAHALLREAHTLLCGGPMPALSRTELGKPFFPDGRFHFSLSHTRTLAACAVSDLPVGVDAETLRPLRPRLASVVLTREEEDWLASRPNFDEALLTLWTCKEALVKRSGEGLQFRPKEAVLPFDGKGPAGFETRRVWDGLVTVCPTVKEATEWRLYNRETTVVNFS